MELNSKKLERTSRIIYYSISLILCYFLISLSTKIIDDLDSTKSQPKIENYENKTLIYNFQKKHDAIVLEIDNLNSKKKLLKKAFQ